ncbi:hypothetical protein FMM05_00245 [Flavobacterium zepuense]|uniref:Uncharacterized protein n=1 Tax=Flavobacterium zepuense TaxID=2593302 RepID=A0A552V9H3_9FLAO|nr:hypothetical protein [Flavobacterium zepuense]TRW27116.1 hypothetical protein FMM05_00245 [Flavobacterium zepuense]
MTITPLLSNKINEYKKHVVFALSFYYKNDYEHTLGDFRKSGEALLKIYILEKFGDLNGEEIILGELDRHLNPTGQQKYLDYQEYLNIAKDESFFSASDFSKLIDLQKKARTAVHNPNFPIDYKANAELCKSQSFHLTELLYKKIGIDIPADITNAYNGKISQDLIETLEVSDWDELYNYVDGFSKQNKYILVAPPVYKDCSLNQLEVLARINWSFVIDFNPDSKEHGLFKSFEKTVGSGFVPLTIKQKGQRNIVGTGAYGSVNWLFANGLKTIADTITKNVKSWLSNRYHLFIKELFSDFFSKAVHRYVIIYLWDDVEYIEEITRIVSQIDNVGNDLIRHVFISENFDTLTEIDKFDKFDINYKAYNLSLQTIISNLANVLSKQELENDKIIVPGRTIAGEQTDIDISDIYNKLLDNHVSIVYKNIEQSTIYIAANQVPAFYQGEQITWKDLSIDIEAKRAKYDELLLKLKSHLTLTKKSLKFELFHKPGAGGTTLAHRVAFDLRSLFPTIVVTHFEKVNTYKSISIFLEKVNRPVLAVVEASNMGLNDVEELIRTCNASKQTVCFLYIRRTLQIGRPGEFSLYLNDAMADISERDKFLAKTGIYTTDKTTIEALAKRQPAESEVIDFSLAINERDYSKSKLIEYIEAYTEKMSDDQAKFTVFASIIYYYSQKSVSELIFRSLFRKGLSEELRQVAFANQYIRKILIQEFDQDDYIYTEYWRPRFSKFAETVLIILLGGKKVDNWKDQIDMYSLELIKIIKTNNEYLVDETRAILKSVFFERNNEDLLGTEEQWHSNVNNDQFSFLIRDIAVKEKQKAVLTALVEAYPNESHFLGHLARFLYEKAEEQAEFFEAETYIKSALDFDGENDYNLQHLGGMCKRRHIEFLKRNYNKSQTTTFSESYIIELSDEANTYFNTSRSINPYNIHAYVAQIQTLILAIDFGRELSGIEKKEKFITSPEHTWYLDQYYTVKKLIDEAQILIEQQETLGKTNKIAKARYYISSSEGHSYELLGNYGTSIEMFKNLIDKADRAYRPQLRLMYIHSTLLNKVQGNYKKIDEAWYKLRDEEIKNIEKALNDNILQDPHSILTLRLWFKLVRYSHIDISTEEIISRLKIWYNNSENSKILNLEASYYLYILYVCLTIEAGDSFSTIYKDEATMFISKCREMSRNSKYSFEWYGKGNGIDCLINHKEKPYGDDSMLERVEGTIIQISSRQQGKIALKSGIEAFFVPTAGNFIEGKDETSRVTFYVGFRHDGLFAIDVRKLSNFQESVAIDAPKKSNIEETQEANLVTEEEKIVAIEEIEEIEILPAKKREYILPGPKVVGSIPPEQLESLKNRFPRKKK